VLFCYCLYTEWVHENWKSFFFETSNQYSVYLLIWFMLPLYSAGFPNERMILSLTLEKSQSMAGPSVPLPPLAHSVTDKFNPDRPGF